MTTTSSATMRRDKMTGYVYVAIAVSTLGGLIFGYDIGVSGAAGGFVGNDFHLGAFLTGAVVSGSTLGGAIGALAGGPLADRFGRRWTLLIAGLLFSTGAAISAVSPNLGVLMPGRVIVGLGVGAASVLVPVYIAELAPPRARGALVAGFQLLTTLGILVGYGINAALASTEAWRWSLGLAAIPGVLLALGVLLIPESPRWLVVQNRREDALHVLRRIRGRDDVDHEIDEITAVNEEDSMSHRGRWRDLFAGWARPMVVVGILVAFFANGCGINLIVFFAPQILQTVGMGASASLLATVGLGVVNVIFTAVGMALVDRVGRRPMLLIGAIGMTVSLVVLAVVLAFPVNGATSAISLACLAVYIIVYAVSPGLVAYVVISEIFPLHVRAKATAAATFVIFVTNLLIGTFSLPLLEAIGTTATLSIFAAVCVAFIVFCIKMPETKGKTLEELEKEFRSTGTIRTAQTEQQVEA